MKEIEMGRQGVTLKLRPSQGWERLTRALSLGSALRSLFLWMGMKAALLEAHAAVASPKSRLIVNQSTSLPTDGFEYIPIDAHEFRSFLHDLFAVFLGSKQTSGSRVDHVGHYKFAKSAGIWCIVEERMNIVYSEKIAVLSSDRILQLVHRSILQSDAVNEIPEPI